MTSVFGLRLRQFREAKKLTLQQVADAVGCTKAYIWELEMRAGQRPSSDTEVSRTPVGASVSRVRSGQRHTAGIIFHDAS